MTTGMKRLVLCADDFGFSEGVCRGIVELARNERISAVSCLVEGPCWPRFFPELLNLATVAGGLVSIGLQWNLTDTQDTASSIQSVIWAAYTGQLKERAAATLGRQLDLFHQYAGRAPDFIAGHQQIQQLPGAREILFETVQRRYGSDSPVVRNDVSLHPVGLKAKAMTSFNGQKFKNLLRTQGLLTNADFEGSYDYRDDPPYGQHMQQWLARCASRGLIVCHPAMPGYRVEADPLASARSREYRFLSSEAFPASLALLGVGLMPLNRQFFSLYQKTGRPN
jgi:predicted glycoside hydrolase/deacetylase ChbG (UPF0249 family)